MARTRIFHGWWILGTSSLTIACSGIMLYGLPAFYPALLSEFGWSRAGLTFGHFLTLGTNSVMQFVFGQQIDRRGARKILVLGTLLTGSAYILFHFVQGLSAYYAICMLLGFGWSAMSYVPNSALVSRWFRKQRGMALGLVTAFSAVGGAISLPLITYLTLHFGWRDAFLWLGITCMAIPLLPLFTIVRESPQSVGLQPDGAEGIFAGAAAGPARATVPPNTSSSNGESYLATIRRNPAAVVLLASLFLLGMFIGSTLQHLILYLRGVGFAPYIAASLAGMEMIFGMGGRLGFGVIADRVSIRSASVICFLLLAASSVLVFSVTVPGVVYLFAICHGIGHGGTAAFIPTVFSTVFPERHMAKNIALGFTVYALGVSAGPPLVGLIFDATGSYAYAFAMNVVMVILAVTAILGFGLTERTAIPETAAAAAD